MGAAPVAKLTVEEYLAMDRTAERPSEFHDGEMFPLADASVAHGLLVNALGGMIGTQLRQGPCRIAAQVRVRVSPSKFLYPDQAVYCGIDATTDTLTNPRAIIEVLSPSTADYDHGAKFALYRMLTSLEEYVLIAQDQPLVEVYRKQPDSRWLLTIYEGLESIAKMDSLNLVLPLADLYADFPIPQ